MERLQISLRDQRPDALREGQRHGRRRPGALRPRRRRRCPRRSACRPRRRPTRCSPTPTCRPRPTAWSRSKGRTAGNGLRRSQRRQSHLPAGQGHHAGPCRCDARHRQGRVHRRRRPVGLRQVHHHEAGHRPAAAVGRRGHGGRREGDRADQGRRHGVPEPDPDAVAHHDEQHPPAHGGGRAAQAPLPQPPRRVCRSAR